MTSLPASPEPPHNRLRADQVSGLRHVLTDSPAPSEAAARPLWQMPPTAAPCDLAYARALAAVSQRIWAASDVALMTRRQLTADQAFALLKHHSQNTHVKLRTIAQTVIQTGDLPVGAESETR
jgi:hypothetical protein